MNVQQHNGQLQLYKQQFTGTVLIHYKPAIKILAKDIVQPLANAEVPGTAEAVEPVVTALHINVVKFCSKIINSDALKSKPNKKVETLVTQHSAVQK